MDRQGRDTRRGRRHRFRPWAEGVEPRHLPSGLIAAMIEESNSRVHAAAGGGSGGVGGGGSGGMNTGASPTTLADLGMPTPHELARERFTAAFDGPYLAGPPRFVGQGKQLLIIGKGTSSAFLRGNLQIGLTLPASPTGTITGQANLIDLNSSNSGNQLGLDLTGSAQAVDRLGRPTHLTWTVNGNSGGTFAAAIGQGTLDIRYLPGLQRHHGKGDGTALTSFRGRIFVSGVSNTLRFDLNTI